MRPWRRATTTDLEPGMGAKRPQHVSDVIAHRLRRQVQLRGDLLGRPTQRKQLENLLLSRRHVRRNHARRLRLEPGNCKDRPVGIVAGNQH